MKWLFIAVVCCQLPAMEGCIFGPGAECALPCRCTGAAPGVGLVTSGGSCDSVTGQCDTGSCLSQVVSNDFVGQLWSGDGCQTGNVALGKAAIITDTGVAANNLVDGWIGSGNDCTSVDTGDANVAASVTVDLGGLYKITHVLVYNTHDSAESGYLENFFVKQGSESPSSTQGCSTYSSQVPQGGNSGRINCAQITPVRYVTIERTPSALNKNRMTLCEVEVYGHIYHDVDCSRCNSPEQCHSDLWCEQCTGGWTGHDCNTAEYCPDSCICNQGSACSSCEQWYVDPDTDCNKHIRVINLESDSIPVIKASTTTTLTITFRQDDMQVDSGVERYYYYVLQYKTAQDSSYTDGTSLIQHVTDLGFRAEREFVINELQKYTAYEIRLVLYRRQSGILQEEISVTASRTGTTDCSDRSKPAGVSATPGQGSFTMQWTNLFYDPTCEHAEVDIYYSPVNNGQGSGGNIRLPISVLWANNPGSYEVANVQAGSYDVFIRITYASNSMVVDSDTVSVTVTALTPAPTPEPTTMPSSTTALRMTTTTSYRPNTDPTENPTTLPTNYSPTPQTPSSTLPQDENSASQFSCSCTCDNSQVVIPAAILSVIVLILIVLLVVSFCYNVRLRRRLTGTKTDRVDDFSDMKQSVYYNTAMGHAAMTVPGIQKPTHGGDGCDYEDVSGNKDTIHQDHTGSTISPAEPQNSSYESMQRQADYSNLPPPPAVYQELGTLGNK